MAQTKTLIIVPAYNEEKTIAVVLRSLVLIADVLVVDDGSTDLTAQIAKDSGCNVISLEQNAGYESALDIGFTFRSKYDFIITIDSDGEIPTECVTEAIKKFEAGFDLVLGIRNYIPRVGEHIVNKFFWLKYRQKDIFCGLKGYRVSKIIENVKMVGSSGTAVALSMLNNSCAVASVDVMITPRKDLSRFGRNDVRTNLKLLKVLRYL